MADPVISPVASESTQTHPVDFAAQRDVSGSHTDALSAPKRAPTTAKSLRTTAVLMSSAASSPGRWYTPVEVAREFRVSRATVYALKSRQLVATRVGLSSNARARPLGRYLTTSPSPWSRCKQLHSGGSGSGPESGIQELSRALGLFKHDPPLPGVRPLLAERVQTVEHFSVIASFHNSVAYRDGGGWFT